MIQLQVVVGIITRSSNVLIYQRPLHQSHGGCWELPGGKIESGESHYEALCRELKEETDIKVIEAQPFLITEYTYTDKKVCLHSFKITHFAGEPKANEGQSEMKWVNIDSLSSYDFPAANETILDALSSVSQ